MDHDLELFFKDFGATLKQTVDLARGVEENCFTAVQNALPATPWRRIEQQSAELRRTAVRSWSELC
jgi:hypothetical protein